MSLLEMAEDENIDQETLRDTMEMIGGVVQECKDIGIETATPNEIERMKQVYDMRRMERNTRI